MAASPLSLDDSEADAEAWWRLWAFASLAHLFGRPVLDWGVDVAVSLLLGLVALLVLVQPRQRMLRTALAVVVVISVLSEFPFIGNHWLVAGFVSLLALIARPQTDGWLGRAAPSLRVTLLVFYSFAAFAKLNSGFFDVGASCARFFANQSLAFWSLPQISADTWIAIAAIWLSVGVELSVPLLLMWRPTRRIGVLLAIAFHGVLALDLGQHFFDFTMVLVPLFLLFTPPGTLAEIDRRIGGPRSPHQGRWTVPLGAIILGFSVPLPTEFRGVAVLASWLLWLLLLAALSWALIRSRWSPSPLSWRLSVPAAAVIAVVALNGLSPYLELKTATGFNMYSNLVTGGGETNHFLIPATAGLRSGQEDLVVIIDSDDEGLNRYVDSGFALPLVNLADYLADNPDTEVTFERGGEVRTAADAADLAEVAEPQSWLARRFLLLRAVPLDDPPRCQNVWLPAR